MNLGELYLAQGRLVEAQTMLHQAYTGFETQGDRWNGAVVQMHQSRLYRTLGLSREALTLAQAAVATLNDQDWQEERGLLLMELLRAQRQAGRHTQAAATIEHALELWTRLGTTLRVAETLGERAMLAIERHHYAAALSDAQQARERFAASGEPRPLWASPARLAEVMALLHLGEQQAARQTCAALLHDARMVGDHWTLQTALTLQARLEQAAGRFAAALDTMTRAADDLELVRRTLTAEELKARFLQQHTTVYDMLVTLAASSSDAAATLRAMLRAKGGGIRDMLQRDRSNRSLPAVAQRELEDLRRQLAWQRAQHQPASTHASHHDAQSAAQEQRILELLRQRQQQLDQPGDEQPPLTAASIAACLPSDGALLEYYLADTTLWGVLLHADGTCHLRLLAPWGAAEHELLEELDLFFAGVVATSAAARAAHPPRQEPVQKRLQTLWQKLIVPWGDLLPTTLCIAPHGSLGSVPFAALWDGTRYLGETHTIATMPGGALLASPAAPDKVDRRPQTADRGSGQPPDDVSGSDAHPALILGYSDNGRVPGVLQEAQVVGQMVPGAQVAMEAHAHSQVLRSLNVPPLLLHIAAHAEVRPDAPLFSFIRLSDGNMALESWYDLPLHATQLVVLSACNTGRIADPGGPLLAFQGALLGAGVQTLVSSLWEANDTASELLMREFYQAWLHGTPPAQALWQAQHVLRTQAAFAHPALWAPFICGGPGALKEPYTSGIAR
jgi:CHAT domain-containing protein/tetratricopeptide (TPR) repeat protein